MLKRTLDKAGFDALAEPVRALYKEEGGQFVLQVEADPRVGEFRENNLALQRQLEEAKKGGPQNAGLAERVSQLTEQLETLNKEKEAAQAEATRAALQRKLTEAGERLGLHAGALEDAMGRAERAGFTIRDGNPVALDKEGNILESGGKPVTLSGFLGELKKNGAGHMFKQPEGVGGASGGGSQSGKAGAEYVTNPDQAWIEANYARIAEGEVVVVHE